MSQIEKNQPPRVKKDMVARAIYSMALCHRQRDAVCGSTAGDRIRVCFLM